MCEAQSLQQLVAPTVSQGIVGVGQQLLPRHQRRDIHPTLVTRPRCGQPNLQLIPACSVVPSQVLQAVCFVGVQGQPTSPQVVDQRPVLSDIRGAVQGEMPLAGVAKPRSIVNLGSSRLCGAGSVVTAVAAVAEYHLLVVLSFPTANAGAVILRQAR